jgi:hypothetical protein
MMLLIYAQIISIDIQLIEFVILINFYLNATKNYQKLKESFQQSFRVKRSQVSNKIHQ